MTPGTEDRVRLLAEVERLRATIGWGQSDILRRLFDFLLDCTLEGRAPKEIEVAQDVFGKSVDFDTGRGASVRVAVHRLRRKLDAFYADAGGPRLLVPKGEYRIILAEPDHPRVPIGAEPEDAAAWPADPAGLPEPGAFFRRRSFRPGRRALLLAGLAVLLACNLAAWIAVARWRGDGAVDVGRRSAIWSSVVGNGRPTVVVVGDYYLIGETDDSGAVRRLVREFAINSRDDLDQHLMAHPEMLRRFINLDLHYLPTGVAAALGDILPLLAHGRAHPRVRVVTASDFTPDMLRTGNVVYIGLLSGLDMLRDPVAQISGFALRPNVDELIDRTTGRHFQSNWSKVPNERTPTRDYAYLAKFPGPTGGDVVIIGGTRDIAITQAAHISADDAQFRPVFDRAGKSARMESLIEVRALGDTSITNAVVIARPLGTQPWRDGS